MLARAPKLFHLVLIAACSVAVAVILTIWHINGITGQVFLIDETNHGIIGSDSHTGNKQNVEEIKSLNQIRDNDETNTFGGMSDSQGENKQDIEENNSIQQEDDNGKNLLNSFN